MGCADGRSGKLYVCDIAGVHELTDTADNLNAVSGDVIEPAYIDGYRIRATLNGGNSLRDGGDCRGGYVIAVGLEIFHGLIALLEAVNLDLQLVAFDVAADGFRVFDNIFRIVADGLHMEANLLADDVSDGVYGVEESDILAVKIVLYDRRVHAELMERIIFKALHIVRQDYV